MTFQINVQTNTLNVGSARDGRWPRSLADLFVKRKWGLWLNERRAYRSTWPVGSSIGKKRLKIGLVFYALLYWDKHVPTTPPASIFMDTNLDTDVNARLWNTSFGLNAFCSDHDLRLGYSCCGKYFRTWGNTYLNDVSLDGARLPETQGACCVIWK